MPIPQETERLWVVLRGILDAIADQPETQAVFEDYWELYASGMDRVDRWTWERPRLRNFVRGFNLPIGSHYTEMLTNALLDVLERRAAASAGQDVPDPKCNALEPPQAIGREFTLRIPASLDVELVPRLLGTFVDYVNRYVENVRPPEKPSARKQRGPGVAANLESIYRDGYSFFEVESGRKTAEDLARAYHRGQSKKHRDECEPFPSCDSCLRTVRASLARARKIIFLAKP